MAEVDVVTTTFKADYSQFVTAIHAMNSALATNTEAFERLSTGVKHSEASILKFVSSSIILKEAFTTLIKAPVDAAAKFEQGFARITRLVDDKSMTKGFEASMKGLISTLPISSEQLFKFGEEALKAGANSRAMFEDLTKLGAELTALDTDGNIGNLVTQIIRFTKSTGEGIDKARDTANILTFLANKFSTNEKEIAKATERFVPFAIQLGITKDRALALGNAFREVNIRSEAGGTVMADFLSKMLKASRSAGSELKGFADITKTSMQEFANVIRTDPVRAFTEFLEGLKRIQAAGGDMESTLKTIGLEGSRATIIFSQLPMAINVIKESLAAVDKRQKDNITTQNQAALVWDTFLSKLQKLKNAVELLADSFGKGLLTQLTNVTEQLTAFINIYNSSPFAKAVADSALTPFIQNVGLLAGAFTAVTVAVTYFGPTMLNLITTFGKWSLVSAAIIGAIQAGIYVYGKHVAILKEEEAQIKKNAQSYETLSKASKDLLTTAQGNVAEALRLAQEIVDTNRGQPKVGFWEFFFRTDLQEWQKGAEEWRKSIREVKDAQKELEQYQKNKMVQGLPNEAFDVTAPAALTFDIEKLAPNQMVAEAMQKATDKLNALKIMENDLGRTTAIINKELAIQTTLFNTLAKIIPQPTAELAQVSTALKALGDELKGIKDEFSTDKLMKELDVDLFTTKLLGEMFQEDKSQEMMSKYWSELGRSMELDVRAFLKRTEQAAKNFNAAGGKPGAMNVAFDLQKDLSGTTKHLVELFKNAKIEVEKQNLFEKFDKDSKAFTAQLEDIRLKVEQDLIAPHEEAKQTMEAASAAMLKFTKANRQASDEYANAAIKFREAKEAYEEHVMLTKFYEIAAKSRQKIENEELAIVDKLRGAQEKYNVAVQAINNVYAAQGMSIKERSKLLVEARLELIQSSEEYKNLEKVFETLADGINSAFAEILTSGKLSAEGLKSIAASILQTLGKIIAQVIATKLVLMLLGSGATPGMTPAQSYSTGGAGAGAVPRAPIVNSPSLQLPQYGYGKLSAGANGIARNSAMGNNSNSTTPQNITIINVTSMEEAQSIAKDKNAIINIISNDVNNRGTVYRTIKAMNK